MARHLVLRGGVYHARWCVPLHLQPVVGRKEIRRSLGRVAPRTARLLAAAFVLQAQSLLMASSMAGKAKAFHLLRLTDLVRHPDGRVTVAEATAETEQDAAALRVLLGETTAAGSNPAGAASAPPDSGIVLVAWVADHKDGWTDKTRQEAESHVQRYLDFAGVEWSVRAKVAAYKTGPLAALAARTRSKHLTRIEHFFRWAVAHGYLADNPATGIRPRMRSTRSGRPTNAQG